MTSITALLAEAARPTTWKASHGFGVVEVTLLMKQGMGGCKDG